MSRFAYSTLSNKTMKKSTLFSMNLLFCFALAFLAACSREEVNIKSESEILVSTDWRYTHSTFTTISKGQSSTEDSVKDCDKDDILRFTLQGEYTLDKGNLKCDNKEARLTSGTWAFQKDGNVKTMTMSRGVYPVKYTLEAVTERAFKISTTYYVTGTQYVVTTEYTAL
jgi:hypothetical protein